MNGVPRREWGIRGATILLALLLAVKAQAHTYIVTDTNDTTAVTSLRGAIIAANQSGGENTIILGEEPRRHQQPQTWTFYLTAQETIGVVTVPTNVYVTVTEPLAVTNGSLTIIGAVPEVTIDVTGSGETVFGIIAGASLELENITITGDGLLPIAPLQPPGAGVPGLPPPPPVPIRPTPPGIIVAPVRPPPVPPGTIITLPVTPVVPNSQSSVAIPDLAVTNAGGGMLFNNGKLTMRNCVVRGNQVSPALNSGGLVNAGYAFMANCLVTSNSTRTFNGAGVINFGSMEIVDTTISRNFVYGGNGGGIYNNGKLNLANCGVKDNTAASSFNSYFPIAIGGLGGGIYNDVGGTLVLNSCTVSGNTSDWNGGGLYDDGTSELNYCLVSWNVSKSGDGGGISSQGALTMNNCEVTANAASSGTLPRGGNGGGIQNVGTVLMNYCTISSNSAGTAYSGLYPLAFWTSPPGSGGSGGGIYNSNKLVMHSCAVTDNSAAPGATFESNEGFTVVTNGGPGGAGGGIFSLGQTELDNCAISGNAAGSGASPDGAGGAGGGIANAGMLTIKACTVNGNIAGAGSGNSSVAGNGGGIYSVSNLSMITCTISGNSAGMGGIGAVISSTGDTNGTGGAGGNGGGLYSEGGFLLNSSTIVSNSAGPGGSGGLAPFSPSTGGTGGAGGNGGGVYDASDGSAAEVENCLIALNAEGRGGLGGAFAFPGSGYTPGLPGAPGLDPDLYGPFKSGGFNLIGAVDGSSGFVNGVGADQVGNMAAPIDPLIGPLQMNGGPTATHALLPGSPAVDQGDSFGIHEDQRVYPRPYNFRGIPNAAGGDGSDIGAFELERGEGRSDREEDGDRDAR